MCMNDSKRHNGDIHSPSSHHSPIKPGGQMHDPLTSSQTPPFSQGGHSFVQFSPYLFSTQPEYHWSRYTVTKTKYKLEWNILKMFLKTSQQHAFCVNYSALYQRILVWPELNFKLHYKRNVFN